LLHDGGVMQRVGHFIVLSGLFKMHVVSVGRRHFPTM
jgi:hypothetical protein